mgnify:CR=1 FL=1
MYSLGVTVHIQPEHVQEFITISREVITQSRAELGCLWYDMLRSEKDPTIFTSYEAYKSEEDFQVHLRTSYVRDWLEKTRRIMTADGIIFPSHSNLYPNNPEK